MNIVTDKPMGSQITGLTLQFKELKDSVVLKKSCQELRELFTRTPTVLIYALSALGPCALFEHLHCFPPRLQSCVFTLSELYLV
jgi:hypothetical protein